MKPIPYGRQNITDEDIQAVIDVLKSDFLTQGPKIQEFESYLQLTSVANMQWSLQMAPLHYIFVRLP